MFNDPLLMNIFLDSNSYNNVIQAVITACQFFGFVIGILLVLIFAGGWKNGK